LFCHDFHGIYGLMPSCKLESGLPCIVVKERVCTSSEQDEKYLHQLFLLDPRVGSGLASEKEVEGSVPIRVLVVDLDASVDEEFDGERFVPVAAREEHPISPTQPSPSCTPATLATLANSHH
jgi:hypothetical protein